MKKSYQKMLGVTLLEIMLVLAIAALVIIMSIRFYQSASTSNKVNAGMSTINSIVAAAESYFNAKGTYSGVAAGVVNYLPGGGTTMPPSPWGGATSITAASDTSYTINMNVPNGGGGTPSAPGAGPCSQLGALIIQNAKFKATCSGTAIAVVVSQ